MDNTQKPTESAQEDRNSFGNMQTQPKDNPGQSDNRGIGYETVSNAKSSSVPMEAIGLTSMGDGSQARLPTESGPDCDMDGM